MRSPAELGRDRRRLRAPVGGDRPFTTLGEQALQAGREAPPRRSSPGRSAARWPPTCRRAPRRSPGARPRAGAKSIRSSADAELDSPAPAPSCSRTRPGRRPPGRRPPSARARCRGRRSPRAAAPAATARSWKSRRMSADGEHLDPASRPAARRDRRSASLLATTNRACGHPGPDRRHDRPQKSTPLLESRPRRPATC